MLKKLTQSTISTVGKRTFAIKIGKHIKASTRSPANPIPKVSPTALLDEVASSKRFKLNKSLVAPEKEQITSQMDGILGATAEEIMDDMNEALESAQFATIFGNKFASLSDALEISSLVLNKDISHAHARWHSPIIAGFVDSLVKREDISLAQLHLARKMTNNISRRLQSNEGKFRSHIIRTINFRRVPRIFFRPSHTIEGLLESLASRVEFLKARSN